MGFPSEQIIACAFDKYNNPPMDLFFTVLNKSIKEKNPFLYMMILPYIMHNCK